MPKFCIIRYELIEAFGHVNAETQEQALEAWEKGRIDLQSADDTTERGPITVFEMKPNEVGPDPLPLNSVTRLREQSRILREALEGIMACVEAEWGADFLPYNLSETADAQANAAIIAARTALEATKEGS